MPLKAAGLMIKELAKKGIKAERGGIVRYRNAVCVPTTGFNEEKIEAVRRDLDVLGRKIIENTYAASGKVLASASCRFDETKTHAPALIYVFQDVNKTINTREGKFVDIKLVQPLKRRGLLLKAAGRLKDR